MRYRSILVPLDGSELAEEALSHAAALANGDAGIMLLRAAMAPAPLLADSVDAQVRAVQEAEEYLGGVEKRLRDGGVKSVTTVVWYGPPVDAIVEAARQRGADLIVMSTHGRSGLGRLVLGSVAERVLRATTTPILLLRHREAPVDALATRREPREVSRV